jgi:hypothetical protein
MVTSRLPSTKLVVDLHQQFNDIKGEFTSINNGLTTIEQRDGLAEAAAATARAERECKAITTKLEVDTKKAMEDAGHAFLKHQKEALPEIVDDLEGNLFNDTMEGPKTNLPSMFPNRGHYQAPSLSSHRASRSSNSPRTAARKICCRGLTAASNSSEVKRLQKRSKYGMHLTI